MNHRSDRIFVSLALFAILFSFVLLPARQAQSDERRLALSPEQIQRLETTGHIIKQSGERANCRTMTEREAAALRLNQRRAELHELSSESANQLQQQQGLKITLRGTQQLEAFQSAKQAFLRAAARWEAVIQTPISIVIDVDFGTTFFGEPYNDPLTLGQTAAQLLAVPNQFAAVRNVLGTKAADARQTQVYGALPAAGLPTDLGTTANLAMDSPVLRALGALPATANPANEMQFGNPPAIGFNSAFQFDFDPTDGIEASRTDFEAVAVHEIGHALGFSSSVGLKELAPTQALFPTIWDVFRFRPGALTLGSITNDKRLQLTGGEHVHFVGESLLPLATGGIDGSAGDGDQSSHWKDDVFTGQYIGMMDPSLSRGLRQGLTAADLLAASYFGYAINPASAITELISIDDNSNEETIALNGAMVVNRFTPSRFPSTLQTVRVQLPTNSDGSSAVGQQMRVVAFIDANRTGQPPANPTLIVDRTITISALGSGRFVEIILPNPPTINAGDVYVGVQSTSNSVSVSGDRNGRQQRRSFISTNNGGSFQPFVNSSSAPLNLFVRAELGTTYNITPTAIPAAISPSAVAPGSAAFTLTVQGNNFRTGSVVRWNGGDRVTTFVNSSSLTAQITAADVANAGTARVTVFTTGGGESAALTFNVTANNATPTIARISPDTAATGNQPVTVSVFGTDFTAQSVVRLNGENRSTTFVNSTQLDVAIPASDLATIGLKPLSVSTPAPGGGVSNAVNLSVISCSFTLSRTSHTISSTGVGTGNVLTTSSACSWVAIPNAPWITLTNPQTGNGSGKFVLNYQVAPNTDAASRTGTINIAGQTVTIRQLGRATSVSAASFAAGLAPNSIGAIFGSNLAKGIQSATSQPLPTNLNGTTVSVTSATGTVRPAQLFFVAPGQINFLVPANAATGTSLISVSVDGTPVSDGVVTLNTVAPTLFTANSTGRGLAAAVLLRVKANGAQIYEAISRFDSTQNASVPVPIDFGDETDRLFLLLYGSGISGRTALSAVSVLVGTENAPVSYAGIVDGLAGLDQVNAELPRSLKGKGEVLIICTVDSRPSNSVTVTFR